jgi:3-oxoacyl-[acyl-carrier protein] reductase
MRSAFDLSGQRILITGAAGGIGEATARVCASLGAGLLLVDRRPTEPLARQLRQGGAEAVAFGCDVASRAEVEAVAAVTGPVDALVLAAGSARGTTGRSRAGTRCSRRSWRSTSTVRSTSPAPTCRA